MSNITIKTIKYKGWKNAIEITNLTIKLIVVPEVGRILHFSFINSDNIFYENKKLEGLEFIKGNYYIKEGIKQAPNIGGNRVLPCSEDYFHLITGSRHIPDPYINASEYKVTFLKNGILLKSPVSNLLGIQIKRKITINDLGTNVNIVQELIKIKPAKNIELEKIPLTIWSLSKIKTPNISYSKLAKNSIFKNGYTISKWPDAKNYAKENASVKNNLLALKSSDEFPQKIGTDSRNWVAGYSNNTLFVEKFIYDKQETYPDNGTSVTIFGNHLFTELECLSPEKKLKINETIRYDLSWQLVNLSNHQEAEQLLNEL
ncbi:hypothetical protein [Polaribacter sp. Asnod6-C07]|uniref:hypothetical protein n=1 Tax=Polaribacter sp. Asnod6-C07 TaxID=3160582 RepID=UPI00386EF0F5